MKNLLLLISIISAAFLSQSCDGSETTKEVDSSISFLFDIDDISTATIKKHVLTVNVPVSSNISFEELKKEVEHYAKKIQKERKSDMIWVNIFWSKEKYKTFKGSIKEGTIKLDGDEFDYLTFSKDTFRKDI